MSTEPLNDSVSSNHMIKIDLSCDNYLKNCELMVDDEGQKSDRNQQKFNPKSVMVPIVCGFKLKVHKIQGCI